MDNRDLFKFKFVNRYQERKELDFFFSNDTPNNILWMDGKQGVGKTRLLQHIQKKNKQIKFITFELTRGHLSKNCLLEFLLLLQKETSLPFKDFIRTNYTQFLDLAKDVTTEILKAKGLDISTLVDMAYDNTKTFVSNNKKQQTASKVITKYLEHIAKDKKTVVIIDNFTYCDADSTPILIEIINNFIQSSNVSFIITTDTDELDNRPEIDEYLLENLPLQPLSVQPFEDEKLFYEILYNIFEISSSQTYLIHELFVYCNGNPDNLKEFLRKLYRNKGILISSKEKASIDEKAVLEIISGSQNTKKYNLNEQIILQVIINFNQILLLEQLQDIYQYILSKCFHTTALDNTFSQFFFELLNNETIGYNELNKVIIKSNSLFVNFQETFATSVTTKMFHFYYLQYIRTNEKQLIINGMSESDLFQLKAQFTYKSDDAEWENINKNYALMLFQRKRFSEAHHILNRLINYYNIATEDEILDFSECYFLAGDYDNALKTIELIKSKKMNNSFRYHLLNAKILNILLQKEQSIKEVNKALDFVSDKDINTKIELLNLKQQILVDINGGKKDAKNIYDSIWNLYLKGERCCSIGNVLKNSIDFYYGTIVLEQTSIAEEILSEHKNLIGLAFAYNNHGFEYCRLQQFEKAQQLLEKSIDLLRDICPHELSYPLNNFANCEMMKQNYDNAISYIIQAQIWNKSDYLSIVLRTMLMICYSKQKEYDSCLKLIKELTNQICEKKITDTTILRKVYANFAIAYADMQDMKSSYTWAYEAYRYSEDTNSYQRVFSLLSDEDKIKMEKKPHIMTDNSPESFYFNFNSFEPWLVTLSHA